MVNAAKRSISKRSRDTPNCTRPVYTQIDVRLLQKSSRYIDLHGPTEEGWPIKRTIPVDGRRSFSLFGRANCLFNMLTSNSFKWSEEQESCLRSLLKFLQNDVGLRTYFPNAHSVLITDASPVGIGAVLEQEGRPVICASRKRTVTEQGYSQTQLHKYLFVKKFTIVTDHEALKFIYHPEKSLARSSAPMVQRWSIALSAYDYTVQQRSAKQIQHVDYIPRQSLQDRPINTSDCLLVRPLPVRRSDLIRETRRYFGYILYGDLQEQIYAMKEEGQHDHLNTEYHQE
ncbi:unnamed protein product [Schistosoma curassoni]|uniref:RT_RNaseH domain-containing protein n=1 Tax=Schistosoma curassoni TaxID=6186 RepID=A0A183KQJ1_9TREM|nr:unnamed protein product [Schistosoma curassoni]